MMQVVPGVGEAARHPMVVRGFDRLLTVQRPAVLAHIRAIRRAHPDASPQRVVEILERRYVTAVTAGGAGVGAAAVVPGVGTAAALAFAGAETAGFLEATSLFAQSVTEVHGISVTDPDRARTVVMALLLGEAGADLVRNLSAQATGQPTPPNQYWGDLIARNVPQAFIGQIATRIRKRFLRRFTISRGTGTLARLVPFGIGAAVGGIGSNILARSVVRAARDAFGPPPVAFPADLQPPLSAREGRRVVPVRFRRALPAQPSQPAQVPVVPEHPAGDQS